jgi:phosphoserine phosphatase RsbU/P
VIGALRGAISPAASAPTAALIGQPGRILCWQYAVEFSAVFAAYFLAGQIGLAVPFTSGNVSPVWPAAGVGLAALLLVGPRVWPAIAAAAFAVNFLSPISAPAAVAISVGNTVGPLVAAWLVRRVPGFRTALGRLDDMLGLILIAAPASAASSATVGATVLFITHVNPWLHFSQAWVVWWLGDLTGVLLVTPLALTLSSQRRITQRRHLPELAALFSATLVACFLIFDRRAALGIEKDVFAFAALPFVLWGATRFEVPGAAGVTLLIAVIAVGETAIGSGPFVRNTSLQNATMLQAFVAVLSVSGLILAVAIVERAELIRRQGHREGTEQSDRRYREIVETANDGIWILDEELRTVFVNPRMAAILGYTVDHMRGQPLSAFIADGEWEQKQAGLQRSGSAAHEHFQTRYRRKDGSDVWADVSRTRAFGEDGALTGVLKMVNDITRQKRAEGERQQAIDRVVLLSKAVEQTADVVLISDSNGGIEYVNPAFESITGYTREEALGNTRRLLEAGQHSDVAYQEMWNRLRSGEPYRATSVHRKKSGELYWANETVTPIKDGSGQISHFVTVIKDVTEVRKYHEQEVRLGLARTVQQRFNPRSPHVPGFEIAAASYPANETGGDYFDFIAGTDGALYVAVGDVSGHGFDAALITSLTRAYMRAFTTLDLDVGEVLHRANRALVADLEENRFVTMLLLRIDVRRGTVTYASAGHVPGVLLDRAGDIDCLMESTGVPLGLFADATFETRRFRLSAGQLLVLGTDGAPETMNADGVEFGSHGVVAYARSHRDETASVIAAGVYRAARSFAAEQQDDDITAVIVKVASANPA